MPEWSVKVLKIYYIGNHEMVRFRDYGEVFFVNYSELDQLDVFDTLHQYDLLLIEISKNYMEKIIRWIFNLHCKVEIPILAILDDCNNRDKLKLDRMGVKDYIDKNSEKDEIESKLENMARLISWQRRDKKF